MSIFQNGKYISLREAAKMSGYAPDYVGFLIRKGKIQGKRVYTNVSWQVSVQSLTKYCKSQKSAIIESRDFHLSKKKYLTLKEAAKFSGYSSDYVGYLIRSKKIAGKKIYSGISWLVNEEILRQYLESGIKKKDSRRKYSDKNRAVLLGDSLLFVRKEISLWTRAVRAFLKSSKYGTAFAILGIVISGALLVWAVTPKNPIQTIEIFPVQFDGDWQNSQNAMGQPDVAENGDLSSFSELNSATYQQGLLSLIVSEFSAIPQIFEGAGEEIQQAQPTPEPSITPEPEGNTEGQQTENQEEQPTPSVENENHNEENQISGITPSPTPSVASASAEATADKEAMEGKPDESSLPEENVQNENPAETQIPSETPLETPLENLTETPTETLLETPLESQAETPIETLSESETPLATPLIEESMGTAEPQPTELQQTEETPLMEEISNVPKPQAAEIQQTENSQQEAPTSFFQSAKKFIAQGLKNTFGNIVKAKHIPNFEELKEKEFVSAKIKLSFAIGEKSSDLQQISGPQPNLTPELSPELSSEPTPASAEASEDKPADTPTPEPAPELTPEEILELTPEPTVEQTPEPTPVITPESTPEPTPPDTPSPSVAEAMEGEPEPAPQPTPEITPEIMPATPTETPLTFWQRLINFFGLTAKAQEESSPAQTSQEPTPTEVLPEPSEILPTETITETPAATPTETIEETAIP